MGGKEKQIKITTMVGEKSEIHGDFSVQGSARIDGKVDGNVTVTGTLIVGAAGCIIGNVSAEAVLIGGEVQGDVQAPEKAELTATAKVLGDIATKVIVIDENAVFQGKCDMNQTEPTRKAKGRATKAVKAGRKSAKAAIAEALKEVAEEERAAAAEAPATAEASAAPEAPVVENKTESES